MEKLYQNNSFILFNTALIIIIDRKHMDSYRINKMRFFYDGRSVIKTL
jgi:hypothetical protein